MGFRTLSPDGSPRIVLPLTDKELIEAPWIPEIGGLWQYDGHSYVIVGIERNPMSMTCTLTLDPTTKDKILL